MPLVKFLETMKNFIYARRVYRQSMIGPHQLHRDRQAAETVLRGMVASGGVFCGYLSFAHGSIRKVLHISPTPPMVPTSHRAKLGGIFLCKIHSPLSALWMNRVKGDKRMRVCERCMVQLYRMVKAERSLWYTVAVNPDGIAREQMLGIYRTAYVGFPAQCLATAIKDYMGFWPTAAQLAVQKEIELVKGAMDEDSEDQEATDASEDQEATGDASPQPQNAPLNFRDLRLPGGAPPPPPGLFGPSTK